MEQRLKKAFSRALNISEDRITDTLEYRSISQWDSIGHMALINEIENEFGIQLDSEDVIRMSTLANAKEILKKYI